MGEYEVANAVLHGLTLLLKSWRSFDELFHLRVVHLVTDGGGAPSTGMKSEISCTCRCFTGNHNDPVVFLFSILWFQTNHVLQNVHKSENVHFL